jgi:hypothetical protein
MSRPTKLTPHRHDKIVAAIRAGSYAEVAARAANIAPSTYYLWLERGKNGEQPFLEFLEAVREAEAQAELEAVTVIRGAARAGDWRAAQSYLERRHPSRWGRGDRATPDWRGDGHAHAHRRQAPAPERTARVASILASVGALEDVLRANGAGS